LKTLLAAIIFVGLAVLLLGVNIFFFKKPFPNGEISGNEELRRRGIRCVKEEEMEMLRGQKRPSGCDGEYSDACRGCSLYNIEKH